MKVLVTGVSGFTGSRLAAGLARRGHDVHGLVRRSSKLDLLDGVPLSLHYGDVADAGAVDAAARGMERVYHIAAAFRHGGLQKSDYRAVNVDGTRNVIAAVRKHGGRLVHCSTAGVHGHVQNPPADETAPFRPDDDYQRTKLEAEQMVLAEAKRGLPASVVRPTGIYGPGDRRFLKLFRSIQNGTFVMFGGGRALYHLTFIDDLVKGLIACGESEKARGEAFIVAGPRALPIGELVRSIARALNVPAPRWRVPFGLLYGASALCEAACKPFRIDPPLYRRRTDFFAKDRAFTAEKIARLLGVTPDVDIDEGLQRTAAWYRAQGWV